SVKLPNPSLIEVEGSDVINSDSTQHLEQIQASSEINDTGSRESRGVALSSGTGRESGYSSEAETKNRRQSAAVRNEFVTSLSRRVEESTRDLKYRFPPEIVDVRMIDFAHVFEEPRSDVDYIYGLHNLIVYFRKVLKQL
uniref:Uncharacterized protein n=1 Tax=Ciona savignyi TaxID=51511 RepID=H2Z025_CIOSA